MMIVSPARFAATGSAFKWRVRATANIDLSPVFALAELEMHETIGGADVCTGGTPVASTIFDATYPATKAFDDNPATDWASQNGLSVGQWISYEFASDKTIIEIAITSRASASQQTPNEFAVDRWDAGTSTWIPDWGGVTGTWLSETRTFKKLVTGQFWRVIETSNPAGAAVMAIAKLEMRLTAGGSDRCTGGTPVGSTFFDGTFLIGNAFDGSPSTSWASRNGSTTGSYAGYLFAGAEDIHEVAITARNESVPAAAQAPRAFDVQRWNASTCSMETVWSVSTGAWGTTGETRVFTKP